MYLLTCSEGAPVYAHDFATLRAALHSTFCSCPDLSTCSNEYLADFDDAYPGQLEEGAHWDLEDGWVSIDVIPESPAVH
jgi:hypothetical protein